jgi:uncharacterized protein (DUF433 family)
MTFDLNSLLEARPGVYGGKLCLAGTRMPVLQIAACFKQGYSAEEIVDVMYPHLELAKVYAALAYYLSNREAVDKELSDESIEYDRLRNEHNRQKAAASNVP